jgi:preprotein translocase subunit SecA
MAWSIDELVQRGHNFAIVDEVDSILIDEARTPLIISGPADQDEVKWYVEFAKIVAAAAAGEPESAARRLRGRREEAHVGVLESRHRQGRGPPRHRQPLRVGQHPAHRLPQQLHQGQGAVQARQGLRRHQRRGAHRRRAHRPHPAGRRYNEGMHQAIEAKEGVEIQNENQTLATITLQNYFRMYDKLSGMTGTAMTEAAEFDKIYKLGVVPSRPTGR